MEDDRAILLVEDFAWLQTDSVKWHVSHLNSELQASELKAEGLTLLNANGSKATKSLSCGPDLQVAFRSYRILFVVDATRSSFGFDSSSLVFPLRSFYTSLKVCLQALLQPWKYGQQPDIYVSIVAQDTTAHPFKVLLQSCLMSLDKLSVDLNQIKIRFDNLEKEITGKAPGKIAQKIGAHANTNRYKFEYSTLGSLLQHGLFAMDRMPLSACPLMILLTDGVGSLPG
jgi:hypothetical protein